MLKESSKVKELRNIRVKLIKESNDFKNDLLEKIWKDLNLSFFVNYNDDVIGSLSDKNKLDRENEKFNKVKDYLNNKDFGKYEVDICKLENYNWYWFRNFYLNREENWGKNWFDYKKEMLYNELTFVLKIKWKGVNMNRVLNEEDGGFRKVSKWCDINRKYVLTGEIKDLKRVV